MRRASRGLAAVTIAAMLLAGIQALVVAAPVCTISGTAGGDQIIGTAGRDVICAKGGNDRIDPKGGNDLVIAGPGRDFVRGSPGADVIKGGLGSDHLVGGPGPDKLFGGDGADVCLNTKDLVSGNDSASGGLGRDTGLRNPGDTFAGIEREEDPPLIVCPPEPPFL